MSSDRLESSSNRLAPWIAALAAGALALIQLAGWPRPPDKWLTFLTEFDSQHYLLWLAQLAGFVPSPTKWRTFLTEFDSQYFLVWLVGAATLVAASVLGSRRGLGLALLPAALVLQYAACVVFPRDFERVFSGLMEWPAAAAAGVGLLALFARQFGPLAVGGGACTFLFCSALGFAVCAFGGWEFRKYPPDFHDEYAYLFQAWSFLDGHAAYPVNELTPAFEQVHVLGRGVFACRYFPGTAIWLVPFVAADVPWLAPWVCGGLTAGFIALAGRRFSTATGYLAGIITATAPGMVGFDNLLMSTGPTMLSFAVFLWAFPAAVARKGVLWPMLTGLAIGFAFLCRPMTAVGLGFPYGLYALHRMIWNRAAGYPSRLVSMITAFGVCVICMAAFNWAVLGTPFETPYSRYTATVTPSHAYGYYNRNRAKEAVESGPDVFVAYDKWAEDLDVRASLIRTRSRLEALFREGLGGACPALAMLILALARLPRADDREVLLWLGCLGLVAAYTPYWFDGVLGYGYFAEAMPLFAILFGRAVASTAAECSRRGRPLAGWAWLALPIGRAVLNVAVVVQLMFASASDLGYPKLKKQELADVETRFAKSERAPVLVLFDADPKDAVHTTLVNNHPRLTGPIVRAWYRKDLLPKLLGKYPERAVLLVRYFGMNVPPEFQRLRGPVAPAR